ncbi:MAG: hypothetical protein ACTSR0_02130 [Candidatus Asgardarchaeia archaeon]
MGKVKKGELCSIEGCDEVAVRSVSLSLINSSKLKNMLKKGNYKRAYLCKKHYKILKKESKKMREVEKLRFSS